MTRRTPLVFAALLFVTGTASAQVKKPVSISVAAGLSVPTGGFADNYNAGFNVLGAVNFRQSASPLSLRIDGSLNQFEHKRLNVTTNVWALTGNAVITPSNLLGPYLIGGLGLYSTSSGGASNSDMGLNLGAGYRFSLSGFDAFLEARWHKITDGGTSFIPVSFGVTF